MNSFLHITVIPNMHIMQIKLCSGQHQMVLGCFTGYTFKENCFFSNL